jgi:hypothetical protein
MNYKRKFEEAKTKSSELFSKKLKTTHESDSEEDADIILPVCKHSIYEKGIEEPKLTSKSIALIENVIPFIYAKDSSISLKLTFEQAFLLYEQEYDIETKEAQFLVNGRQFSSAVGEKFPAIGAARQKFCDILLYYCWSLKVSHFLCLCL